MHATYRTTTQPFLSTPSSQRATPDAPFFLKSSRISIHALFAEGDAFAADNAALVVQFLSTPSSQRATPSETKRSHDRSISIHALFAEGDLCLLKLVFHNSISIHALFAEGDHFSFSICVVILISIHALFAEGDSAILVCTGLVFHFYPRPLRRGRPLSWRLRCRSSRFLSTPSSQRATYLRTDGLLCCSDFYPRPLRRGRLLTLQTYGTCACISIHALFAEGDGNQPGGYYNIVVISIHALFAEGDV